MNETNPHKMNQLLLAIVMTVSLVLIAAAGSLGYYLGKLETGLSKAPTPTVSPPPTSSPSPTAAPTASAKSQAPAPTTAAAGSKTIDFAACNVGDGYSQAVGYGSTSLRIVESGSGVCVVQTRNETETTLAASQCNVPKSLGKLTITIGGSGSDFSAIKPYCNINSTTNINIHN